MSNIMNVNEKLPVAWDNVYQTSEQAINWVNQVRGSSKRLDNEADSLILDLRRLRNRSKRLGDVSTKSVAVGFFGLSQAGKSYLISALAADENGKLETVVDGEKLDFITHVNPTGNGKEATGIVTRFSRIAKGGISDYPLMLKIFKEIEIVKILVNAYFKDFDQQKVVNNIDLTALNRLFTAAEDKKQLTAVLGMTEDDIVDLYDYVKENFGNSVSYLNGGYWEKIINLAPYLTLADRGELFSVLWGKLPELTSTYIQLATTLSTLGNAETVYAPLSVIIKEENGVKSQIDSIMNVDMVGRLNMPNDLMVSIMPDGGNRAVTISLAQLAFLTSELIFPLINRTRVTTFENVDLLDFPGYRGRLNLTHLADVKEGNPIAQLLLRGKVAYLFEKYTDSQEMNVLIVCTPSDAQLEVNDVGPVLERWIDKTQGETAEKRSTKKPGLLWALTKFDKRIGSLLTLADDQIKNQWGKNGLLGQTIFERFGNYDWLNNWSGGQKFNNLYLVRKPGMPVPFINIDPTTSHEVAYSENYHDKLQQLKDAFIQDSDINEYVADPAQAWDAMLKLDDGGMARISDYLEQVAITDVKQQRIIEQLNEEIEHIASRRFGAWYQADNDEELSKKREMIASAVKELQTKAALLLGELLKTMELPDETIRALYHTTELNSVSESGQQAGEDNNPFSTDFGFDSDFDIFDNSAISSVTTKQIEQSEPESKLGKAVFSAWIEHLRNIVLDKRVAQYFGITEESLSFIVEELITAANRLNLEEKLNQEINNNENMGSKRDDLESRQVSTIHILLADFIAWLGFVQGENSTIPMSKINQGMPIFSPPAHLESSSMAAHRIPKLDENTRRYTQIAVFDWFIGFSLLAQENVGHSAGREISQEQNSQLGQILSQYKNAAIKQ